MRKFFFNERKGNTVLSKSELLGLKLGHITTLKELDEAEQLNINEGLLWAKKYKGPLFDEVFFRTLHKMLFGEVWKWAGAYRTTEKNIGIEYWQIPGEIKLLLENVNYWLENRTYSQPEFLARMHHRLVFIHPFPNGNGRFSRIIVELHCAREKWPMPDWYIHLEPHERREKYIYALQQADEKHFQPLIEYMTHVRS